MSTIATERGKQKLTNEGFLYCFDKMSANGSKQFWRCERKNSCKARLHTGPKGTNVLLTLGTHTHGADAAHVDVARHVAKIKERARTTMETPMQIINNVCQSASQACLGQLSQADSLRKVVQRVRKDDDAPALPTTRGALIIPRSYAEYNLPTGSTESFVVADSGIGDADRIVVFGREETARWINNVQRVYLDGTFCISPSIFNQVFLISMQRGAYVFPTAYALLPDKTEATYKRMLRMLVTAWPNFKPSEISLDFEAGLINAAKTIFPAADLQGCLFHLSQNIKKHLRQLGLIQKYNDDGNFALWARMVPALSFVPPTEVENAFDALSAGIPPELQPLLDYFEDNYLGRLGRNGRRRPPLFSHSLWSVYGRTLAGIGRTNNYAEAANRKLQREFGVHHPTIFKFIGALKKFQVNRDKKYEEFILGQAPTPKRRKYVLCDERILTIVNDFNNRTNVEYLRGIAHNFLIN